MNQRCSALVVACVVAAATAVPAAAEAAPSHPGHPVVAATGLRAGVMPMRGAAVTPALSTVNLTYRGGRVLTNPVVDSVLWGSGTYQGVVSGTAGPRGLGGFFGDVLHSPYLAWLDEYRVPASTGIGGESVEYGDFGGSTQLPGAAPATISDATIQTTLATDIGNGTLPAPVSDGSGHSDSVYALFFPSGTTITDPNNAQSMVDFCAYHGTTSATVNGMHLTYMVLPDPTPAGVGASGGCGPGATYAAVLESYTTHELAETITDPDVGIATGTGAGVLGWYDDINGEVSDICDTGSNSDATVDGFEVQKNWSNAVSTCVATRPTVAAGAPTGVGVRYDANRAATLRWTSPGGPLVEYDVQEAASGSAAGVLGRTVAHVLPGTTSWTTPGAVPAGTRFSVVARSTDEVASPAVTVTLHKSASTTGGTASVLSRHRVRLNIQVRSTPVATGRLRISLGTKVLTSLTLTAAMRGHVVVVVRLAPGRHRLTATYAGSATVVGSRHSWTVSVPR